MATDNISQKRQNEGTPTQKQQNRQRMENMRQYIRKECKKKRKKLAHFVGVESVTPAKRCNPFGPANFAQPARAVARKRSPRWTPPPPTRTPKPADISHSRQ